MRHLLHGTALILALLPAGTTAWAQASVGDAAPDWNVFGTASTRGELYGSTGNAAASPFPDTGLFGAVDLTANFDRRLSDVETIEGDIGLLLNQSDYRSDNKGMVLERFRLEWEKGDTRAPFRATAGDFFAFFSPRTVQRSVKGLQLEFQPTIGGSDAFHSVLLFAGLDSATYRGIDSDADVHAGLSWFLGQGDVSLAASSALNWDEGVGQDDVFNSTSSLAFETPVNLWNLGLTLEGEVAGFVGQNGQNADEQSDLGLFLNASGRSERLPLTWSLLYERYGEDFNPGGASIQSDRSTVEARTTWRFPEGIRASARLQRFDDNLESGNRTTSHVAGLGLSGAFWPAQNVVGSLDSFIRMAEDENQTTDQIAYSTRMDLTRPFGGGWTGRLGTSVNLINDSVNNELRETYNLTLGASRGFEVRGIRFFASPSVFTTRTSGGTIDSWNVGPRLNLSASKGEHSANLSYSLAANLDAVNNDLISQNASASWRWSRGSHAFNVSADHIGRHPIGTEDTNSFRLGVFYTYSFNRPARGAIVARPGGSSPAETGDGSPVTQLDPVSFGPDLTMAEALARTEALGMGAGISFGTARVFETVFLRDFDERQRFVLVANGAQLDRSAVIIDFNDTGRPDRIERTFDRVRTALTRRYGPPVASFAEGSFSNTLAADLAAGEFVRIDEWQTPEGRLRFGIPRRLDNQVRMEIHHARRFPPTDDPQWSLEAVQ
ncbi:MAG: hypothetical protein P1U37_15815 [Minwuia sp.]|nr:hypothetical protein [Minwuia sp.]